MEVGLDELELYRINSYNYYCGNNSSSNKSFFKWCPSGQAWFQDQSMMGNYLVIQPCLKNISLIELCTFFLCAQTFSSKGAVNSTTLICDLLNWFKNKIKTPEQLTWFQLEKRDGLPKLFWGSSPWRHQWWFVLICKINFQRWLQLLQSFNSSFFVMLPTQKRK